MTSSVLAVLLAAMAFQASDTTRAAREAFTRCLRAYADQSVQQNVARDAFAAAYPQQCTQQEAAFRDAIIRRDTALRATRASAEDSARQEIEDARTNFRELFEMSIEPQ